MTFVLRLTRSRWVGRFAAYAVLAGALLLCTETFAQDRLVFTNAPRDAPYGRPSGSLRIQRQTSAGVPITTGSLTVNMTSGSASGSFNRDEPFWTAPASTLTIPAGSSSTPLFYYRDTVLGPVILTASATAFTSATQTATVTALGFTDDYESGTFDAWSNFESNPANTRAVIAAAAHRGSFGARYTDVRSGAGSENEVGSAYGSFISGTAVVRSWFRIVSTNNAGTFYPIQLVHNGAIPLLDLRVVPPNSELRISGFDAASNYAEGPFTGPNLALNTWHLLEAEVTGVGTASGTVRLWVDGTLAITWTNRNWNGLWLDFHTQGEYFGDVAWVGTIDFDDYRESATRPASKLRLSPTQPLTTGSCVATTVALDTSSNGVAQAPYAVTVALSLSGVTGAFYSESGCVTSTTTALIPTHSSQTTVWVQALTTGTATLTAQHIDFLDGVATPTVTASGANRLVFTNAPRSFVAGVCGGAGGAITVQLQTSLGTPIPAGGGGQGFIAASDSVGTATFFTDPGCSNVATGGDLSIAAGTNSVSLYYRDTAAGNPAISITNPDALTDPLPQVQTVIAGPAEVALLSNVTNPLLRGDASSVSMELQDAFGNRVLDYAGTVRFSSSDPLATLPPDYAFLPADQGTRTFLDSVRFGTAGTHTLTVTDVGGPTPTGTLGGIVVTEPVPEICTLDSECASGLCVSGFCAAAPPPVDAGVDCGDAGAPCDGGDGLFAPLSLTLGCGCDGTSAGGAGWTLMWLAVATWSLASLRRPSRSPPERQ